MRRALRAGRALTGVGGELGAIQRVDELAQALLVAVHLPVAPHEELPGRHGGKEREQNRTGGYAKVSGDSARGNRRPFYSPAAAETTPPRTAPPRAQPRPLSHPRSPSQAGRTQEPGGVFPLLFCPSCILACLGHTRGSAARGPPCCPPHAPARRGGKEEPPPFTSHTYTQAPSSPPGQQGGGIIPPSSEALGLCVMGVGTVRTFPIERDIPNPPNSLHSCPWGLQPPVD